jgi:signal recognition particle GTPase
MMGSCLEPPKLEEAAREAMPTFPADVEALMNELNPEQMQVFKKVFAKLIGGKSDGKNDDDGKNNDVGKPLLLMLHGEAGSGKTYLYGKICKAAEMMVGI